ncbi:glutamate--cysteine ligase [Thermobifida halotolerans]|uniref:Putative glutamate--cysteine ligase 2 n=1 Tax=Thermobifida halotolerans TaxID=483545 RepID=A0A399G7L6_9ACTN|nr:glutamate--cysteine ligase [Thermobifida halotolerans]UOE20351.1 glutamate--cysteine ligase [Thermobifida halotolerans]
MADPRGVPGLPTMGVEEEFLLVDAEGRLAEAASEILAAADPDPAELHPELTLAQVEAASGVHCDSWSLLEELRHARRHLSRAAADRGLRLVAVGAPPLPTERPPALSPDPRYARMREELGPLLDAGGSAGCHVHVAVPDLASALRALNHLRPWLPALLALTANSPFFSGVDTGYASWRYVRWSQLPSACPPPFLSGEQDYTDTVDGLLDSQAALDPGMLYWDARPSSRHPTLEVRVGDVAATAEEAVLLAVLVRGLVAVFLTEDADSPAPRLPPEVLRAHMWRAARDGVGGHCLHPVAGRLRPVREVLEALLERIAPVLERSGDARFARTMTRVLCAVGCGAQRQRDLRARCSGTAEFVDRVAETTVGGPFRAAHGSELVT